MGEGRAWGVEGGGLGQDLSVHYRELKEGERSGEGRGGDGRHLGTSGSVAPTDVGALGVFPTPLPPAAPRFDDVGGSVHTRTPL